MKTREMDKRDLKLQVKRQLKINKARKEFSKACNVFTKALDKFQDARTDYLYSA